MDLIGKIYLASSKGHNFILVATYYFTKWVKAVPLKKVELKDVIQFIKDISFIDLEFLSPLQPTNAPCSFGIR